MTGACSFVVCKLGSCCIHSSAPQFDRSLREGAPCATLSMLTYYRTSRSLHFPFWAVCSLSGAQPEIWSVGWNPPVHRIAFRLFVAFPFNPTSFVVSPAGGRGGPGLLWPGPLGPIRPKAQAAPATPAPLQLFLSMRVCRRSVASHARLLARSGAAAFGRSTSGGAASGRTAPPAPLCASFGRTAMLPNPASLAGDDASAARYTPQRTRDSNEALK